MLYSVVKQIWDLESIYQFIHILDLPFKVYGEKKSLESLFSHLFP